MALPTSAITSSGARRSSTVPRSACASSDPVSFRYHLIATDASTIRLVIVAPFANELRGVAVERTDAIADPVCFRPKLVPGRFELLAQGFARRLRERLALRLGRFAHAIVNVGIDSADEQVGHRTPRDIAMISPRSPLLNPAPSPPAPSG